jgi:hypothetical protein
MVTVSSPAPLLLLAPTLEPPASSLLMPNLIQADEAPSFLLAPFARRAAHGRGLHPRWQ